MAQDVDALEYEHNDDDWSVDGAYYERDEEDHGAAGEPWPVEGDVDSQAAYFRTETEDTLEENFPWQGVGVHDAACAAYLDARRRFSDLKLSRGYLPIVALSDPAARNLNPRVSPSPTPSPSSKGKKGKSGKGTPKGGSLKGKSGASCWFSESPMKQHHPRGRASAALHCLRCGQPGHFAANCPVSAKTGTKRPATETVAQLEDAHVTFMNFKGHERYDVAMLDPGASAFLSEFGPARRCLHYLAAQDTPSKMSSSIDAGTSFILEVMVNAGVTG